jgi:hypothetical protein
MSIKIIKKIGGILILSAVIAVNLNGQQTRNDVINVYNDGAKAQQTDIRASIEAFEKVITLSDQVGETAADLKQKAVAVLPGLYVKAASNCIAEKKPSQEIIKAAKTAIAASEKYGSAPNKENATKILTQGYYNLGTELFTKKDYEHALLAFDSLLAINPGYQNAFYNKALIFRGQGNSTAFEENIDLYLEKVKSNNDSVKVKQASKIALEYFRASGSKSNQANKLDEAITSLTKASKYGEDKDLFYYFADVYNKQKKYDSGIEYAQKGLALETGAAEAKAKFYFQVAMGQAGKGQTAEACESFKNSMFGPFAEPSKVQRTNLKCK